MCNEEDSYAISAMRPCPARRVHQVVMHAGCQRLEYAVSHGLEATSLPVRSAVIAQVIPRWPAPCLGTAKNWAGCQEIGGRAAK